MKRDHLIRVVGGVALVGLGYLAGFVPGASTDRDAVAGPLWDAQREAYVTGDSSSLTFWKLDGEDVVQVTSWVVRGSVFWPLRAKRGEAQELPMPAPIHAPSPAPAPVPAEGGAACGGNCGK